MNENNYQNCIKIVSKWCQNSNGGKIGQINLPKGKAKWTCSKNVSTIANIQKMLNLIYMQ